MLIRKTLLPMFAVGCAIVATCPAARADDRPTPEVIARPLPEGVLNHGGRLDAYLYFEKPQQQRGASINLLVKLSATDGADRPFVSLSLPFVMDHTPPRRGI